MIDFDALKAAGFTNARLKQIFTSKAPEKPQPAGKRGKGGRTFKGEEPVLVDDSASATGPTEPYQLGDKKTDWDIRQMLEKRFAGRLREGWRYTADNYKLWLPVDLAWDSPPITESNLPLMLLAQGKVSLESCQKQIEELEATSGQKLIERDERKRPLRVNMPKFFEVSHNLMKQLVTRRVAAISARYDQYPFLKYESRYTSAVGKCRADVMTGIADTMAEDFNYKHKLQQWIRDQTLYTQCVCFADRAWTSESQVLPQQRNDGTDRTVTVNEETVVKEGVNFVDPHPSRTFWDFSASLADINADIGPSYIGFWDLYRFRDIRRQSDVYWNTDTIDKDTSFFDMFEDSNRVYFDLYYKSDAIKLPEQKNRRAENDRKSSVTYYAENNEDDSVVLSQYYEKIIPKQEGIGSYDHPVWVRFVIAGTKTVVFAEIMPSTPAFVIPYNANDNRLVNTSFAHDCLPYQDQINNLLSQLLQIQKQGLTKVIELDTDGMTTEDIQHFKRGIAGDNYYASNTHVIEFSGQKMADLGLRPQDRGRRVFVEQFTTSEKTNEIFNSILKLMNLAERALFFTAQEMGQYVTKETNATEVNAVNSTTLTMHDFHAKGVEEGLAAMKRIIYESKVALGEDTVIAPVFDRYPLEVIQRAGFTVYDSDGDPATTDDIQQQRLGSGRFTLTGGKASLIYNYTFTSREGINRAVNSQVSQLQLQLATVLLQSPQLLNAVPREKIAEMLNEAYRNSGSGFNLNMRFPGDGSTPLSNEQEQMQQQNQQSIQQIVQALQGLMGEMQSIKQQSLKNAADTQQLARSIQTVAESVRSQVITSENVPAGAVAPGAPTRGIQ